MLRKSSDEFILFEVSPYSLTERVKTKVRWSRKNDTNPDIGSHMTIEVPSGIEAQEGRRAQKNEAETKRKT